MNLDENDKLMIDAINTNDVDKICELFMQRNFNNFIFTKNNINLFDKNARFLNFFRGLFYFICNFKNKYKILMKYDNPFIFLFYYFGANYYDEKKYNKAKFYLKKNKYNGGNHIFYGNLYLKYIYLNKQKYIKNSIYYIRSRFTLKVDRIKYLIGIILNIF